MENCVQKIKWLIGDTSIYPVSSLSHEQRSYDSSKLLSGRNTCVSDIQVVFKLFKLRSVFTFIKTKIFKCVFYNTNSSNYIHLNSLLFKKKSTFCFISNLLSTFSLVWPTCHHPLTCWIGCRRSFVWSRSGQCPNFRICCCFPRNWTSPSYQSQSLCRI